MSSSSSWNREPDWLVASLMPPVTPWRECSSRSFLPRSQAQACRCHSTLQGLPGGGQTGATDETGRYEIRGLDAGLYTVHVNQPQGPALAWADPADPEQPTAAVELRLAEGEQRDDHELRIEARDGVIVGRVVGADEQPIPDAWVRVTRQESPGEYFAQLSRRLEHLSGWRSNKPSGTQKATRRPARAPTRKRRRRVSCLTVSRSRLRSRTKTVGSRSPTSVMEPTLSSPTGRAGPGVVRPRESSWEAESR